MRNARDTADDAIEGKSERSGRPVDNALKEFLLFASIGINVVAVVIARQYYLRYRMLIREYRETDTLPA